MLHHLQRNIYLRKFSGEKFPLRNKYLLSQRAVWIFQLSRNILKLVENCKVKQINYFHNCRVPKMCFKILVYKLYILPYNFVMS